MQYVKDSDLDVSLENSAAAGEPEHSVIWWRSAQQTQPPTEADALTTLFEDEIKHRGEERARWDRLMTLLEEGDAA